MRENRREPETVLLIVLQIVCAAAAIGSLPQGLIHPLWLATFIAPSAIFLFLGTGARRAVVPLAVRFLIGAATMAGAAYLTYTYYAPLDEKSSLACSLLPALTFFTLRREPSDTSLSLFLSFCFLLIGIMLNQNSSDWTLLVYLFSCAWALQIEASHRALQVRHAVRGATMTTSSRLLRRFQVVAALMMAAFLLYQGLNLLPSPGQSQSEIKRSRSAGRSNRTMVGLSTKFDLTGSEGAPVQLADDKTILVHDPSNRAVPHDLYLRMTFFDRARLQQWLTWPTNAVERPLPTKEIYVWEPRDRRLRQRQLVIRRLEPALEGELFLPPGTEKILGVSRMRFDSPAGYFVSTDPKANTEGYEILYRRPHKRIRARPIDRALTKNGAFRSLPRSLRSEELTALAAEYADLAPGEKIDPMELARRITRKLQARCQYRLRDPQGPYGDSLHNFLFAERKGYCMHFATALAVLLRINRVPCRIAVGFHAGEVNKTGPGRIFGSRHAHAWVELPLQHTGWTLIDPTPAAGPNEGGWPRETTDEEQAPQEASAPVSPTTSSCFLDGLADPLANPAALLTLVLVFVAVSIFLVIYLFRRSAAEDNAVRRKPNADVARARRMLEQILGALAKGGLPKFRQLTLEQYLQALRNEDDADVDVRALAGAFRAYQEIRFGDKELDERREAQLAAGVETARSCGN